MTHTTVGPRSSRRSTQLIQTIGLSAFLAMTSATALAGSPQHIDPANVNHGTLDVRAANPRTADPIGLLGEPASPRAKGGGAISPESDSRVHVNPKAGAGHTLSVAAREKIAIDPLSVLGERIDPVSPEGVLIYPEPSQKAQANPAAPARQSIHPEASGGLKTNPTMPEGKTINPASGRKTTINPSATADVGLPHMDSLTELRERRQVRMVENQGPQVSPSTLKI